MFCVPLPRLTQCSVLAAAIITMILPPQSLLCRHCLLHDAFDSVSSGSLGQWGAEHSCDLPCDQPRDEHSDENHHPHGNCPCSIGDTENAMLVTSSSGHAVEVTYLAEVWLDREQVQPRMTLVPKVEFSSASGLQSLPNVLRI